MRQSLYGKYPGALKYDSKYVENCSEMELFVVVSKYYEVVRMRNYCNKMINFAERSNDQEMKKHFEEMLANEKKKNPLVNDNPQEYSYTLDYCLFYKYLNKHMKNTYNDYNPSSFVNELSCSNVKTLSIICSIVVIPLNAICTPGKD